MNKDSYIEKRIQVLLQEDQSRSGSFIARNYNIFLVSMFFLYPIAAIYSAITEGGNLYTRFEEQFSSQSIAICLTVVLVLFIEAGSIFFGKSVADDLVLGVMGEKPSFQAMFAIKLCAYFAFFAFSSINSIQGAPQSTEYLSKKMAPPALLAVDSVETHYQKMVDAAALDAQQYFERRNWKGRIGGSDQKEYSRLLGMKTAMQDTLFAKVEAAKAENSAILAGWTTSLSSTQSWSLAFAWLGQGTMLLCLIIYIIYRPGERNEVREALEKFTGIDINGDGHVGKPVVVGIDEGIVAKVVAQTLDAERSQRKVVKPFQAGGSPPTPSGGSGPAAAGVQDVQSRHIQAAPLEVQDVQPERVQPERVVERTVQVERNRDLSGLKQDLRNAYRRKAASSTLEAREENRRKYEVLRIEAEKYFIIEEVSESRLKLTPRI